MSDTVIKVENLGKKYKIGSLKSYNTLRDKIADYFKPNSQSAIRNPKLDQDFWALKEVNFEVKQGELVGIIGRNGAGKSTLLKILSQITEPTIGRIELHGSVGSLLEVGTGFHPELTGRENIFLNGAILGMKRTEIKAKFDAIVAFAEVEKFIDTPVKRYSSGMYVRLAFAVAAHLEPEILMVDEVLAVGDAQFQKRCLGKMGEVAKEGRTVLFVSHNMAAIKSLCKKAFWLDKGLIVQSGEANRIVESYLQQGTVSLLKQEWNDLSMAPGNEKVRIRSARILLQTQTGDDITVDTPIQLEFEIWNNIPDAVLNINFHFYTIEGTYVFAITSEAKPRHRGLVKGTAKIPQGFLNDCIYSVALQIVKDHTISLYVYSAILVFEVHDTTRAGNWFGKWPGVVRPQFEFPTEDISGPSDL